LVFTLIGEVKGIPVVWQRPDSIAILDDKEAQERLERYFKILRREALPKFLIAKMIEVEYSDDMSLEELWKVHAEKMKELIEFMREKDDEELITLWKEGGFPKRNLLTLKRDILWKILESCHFCEWRCGINRVRGEKGVCRLNAKAYVSSVFIHIGEEPELVPSYTIFFSHCNFKCVYCQNWDISQIHSGDYIAPEILAETISREWERRRIRNVNWVGGEPTPNIHYIFDVLVKLNAPVPQVWNSNLYNSLETMKILLGTIDVWLPDFKYGNNECGLRLSKVPKYFDVVARNHKILSENNEEVIIRHLVLPNHFKCCTEPILKWIAENMRLNKTRVNVMAQYRPEYKAHEYPEIARRLRIEEWERAVNYAKNLGLSLTM